MQQADRPHYAWREFADLVEKQAHTHPLKL